MLSYLVAVVLGAVKSPWERTLLCLAALGTVSLVLWRLLVFTLLPSFRPREPRSLSYWIPCKSVCSTDDLL